MVEPVEINEDDALWSISSELRKLNENIKNVNENLTTISNQLFEVFNQEGDGEVKIRILEKVKEL